MHPRKYFKEKFMKTDKTAETNEQGNVPVNLAELPIGKSAIVVELEGSKKALVQFETLGLIPGARIEKLSAAILHGPIILKKDLTKFAIGYKIAKKVLVAPIE